MNKAVLIIIIAVVLVLLGGGVWLLSKPVKKAELGLKPFAQCLTDSGIKMYGAYWCPHCQSQKKLFGDADDQIPYVECTQETALCTEKGITGYPTWITADGQRLEGEQPLVRLSEVTSCPLP